jgi:hypothetical protein
MNAKEYVRPGVGTITRYLEKVPELIHIIIGPRQVGKTTAARRIIEMYRGGALYVSADDPIPPGPEWIAFHWDRARRDSSRLLVIDEIQKVKGWSEAGKKFFDEDRVAGRPLRVLLLGSSALLIGKGLSESLSGRFYLHRLSHWDYPEMKDAFSLSLDEWIYFGGYPGAAVYREDEKFWKNYVRDSLVETVLSKDILQMETVHKPALLRHLFYLAAGYPAEILSYNKMLGQLVDAGNATTLAHYLTLLGSAYLVSGLEQFKPGGNPKRGSSPKLIVRNNALVNASAGKSFKEARDDHQWWGRLVENAVGLTLLNWSADFPHELFYWRRGDDEVDFILAARNSIWAVEVKSSRIKSPRGLRAFTKLFPKAKPVIIGGGGIPLEEFFLSGPEVIFS